MNTSKRDVIQTLSRKDLQMLGVGQVAYARMVKQDGQPFAAIMGADGQRLAAANDLRGAWIWARNNDLDLATVH